MATLLEALKVTFQDLAHLSTSLSCSAQCSTEQAVVVVSSAYMSTPHLPSPIAEASKPSSCRHSLPARSLTKMS